MKFTVLKRDLLRELKLLLGVIEESPNFQILSHVLIESTDKDSLSLAATDLDVALQTVCAAEVQEPGAIVLPAKKLAEIVEGLPGPVIVVSQKPDNDCVVIRSECANFELLGLDREQFPKLPQAGEFTITLLSSILDSLISRTVYAITMETSRYILDGALLLIEGGSMQMVATDGHRLAIATAPTHFPNAGDVKAIMPCSRDASMQFGQDETRVFFSVGQRELSSRKLTQPFPEYRTVIPKTNDKVVSFSTVEFSQAVARAAIIADEISRRILITLGLAFLTVSAYHDDFGKVEEAIGCDYVGDPITLAFRLDYLSEFLATVSAERLVMAVDPEHTDHPITLKPEGDSDYTYVLMPMRNL